MSWQKRLRDMMLAGGAGALAALGCVDDSVADGQCCNANPDPCCRSLYCGDPETTECACESDGGTWDFSGQACSRFQDSAPTDAPPTVSTFPDGGSCCNANPDPCCASLYCGDPVAMTCLAEMACVSGGGTWDLDVQGCAVDGGPLDATADALGSGPPDAGTDGRGQAD